MTCGVGLWGESLAVKKLIPITDGMYEGAISVLSWAFGLQIKRSHHWTIKGLQLAGNGTREPRSATNLALVFVRFIRQLVRWYVTNFKRCQNLLFFATPTPISTC